MQTFNILAGLEVTAVDTVVAEAITVPATEADSVVVSARRVPIVEDLIEDGKPFFLCCFIAGNRSKEMHLYDHTIDKSIEFCTDLRISCLHIDKSR